MVDLATVVRVFGHKSALLIAQLSILANFEILGIYRYAASQVCTSGRFYLLVREVPVMPNMPSKDM